MLSKCSTVKVPYHISVTKLNNKSWTTDVPFTIFFSPKFTLMPSQGGITCGAIDEPRKSSKVIDVIDNFSVLFIAFLFYP